MAAAAATGTRRGVSNATNGGRPKAPRDVANGRLAAKLAADALGKKARSLIVEYDTSGAGKLDRAQITRILTDLSAEQGAAAAKSKEGRYAPSDRGPSLSQPSAEEVDFLFSCADCGGSWKGSSDGFLDVDELEEALVLWRTFHDNHEEFETALARFDADGSGNLEQGELKNFLTHLNGGREVSDSEVKWVMRLADCNKDGCIEKIELMKATSEWYSYAEHGKSSICVVL